MERRDSAVRRRQRGPAAPFAWALLIVAGLPLANPVWAAQDAPPAVGVVPAADDTAVDQAGDATSGDLLKAAAPAMALDRIRSTETIRLGYVDGARPFSYRDESGNVAGYTVALCERVADAAKSQLGLRSLAIEWVAQSFEQRLGDLQSGRVDVACSAGAVTLGDRAQASYSVPVFPGSVGALVRRDASSRLTELLEEGPSRFRPFWRAAPAQILGEQTFAAVPGSVADDYLEERTTTLRLASRVVHVTDVAAGVQSVLDRQAQVFFGDRALLLDAAQQHPARRDLMVLAKKFTFQPIALGVARGDEDMRLLVDRTLSDLYRSGELLTIYQAAFGEADEATLSFFRMSVLPE